MLPRVPPPPTPTLPPLGPVLVSVPWLAHAAPVTLAAIQARPTGHAVRRHCLLVHQGIIPGTATPHRAVRIVRQIAADCRKLRQIAAFNNFTQYT
jgi:hypothetical protein